MIQNGNFNIPWYQMKLMRTGLRCAEKSTNIQQKNIRKTLHVLKIIKGI